MTQCDVTENSDSFVVNIYNPLPRTVSPYVRLPVQSTNFEIICPCGHIHPSQVVPIPKPVLLIPGKNYKRLIPEVSISLNLILEL